PACFRPCSRVLGARGASPSLKHISNSLVKIIHAWEATALPESMVRPSLEEKPVFLLGSALCFPLFLACLPRRLDANRISSVPPSCFRGLHSLRHLWLDDNALTEIPVQALRSLSALQAMTLALNKIHHIPDYAFGNLSSLVVL
ncbi:hypothetical protein FD755_010385, partial [Muntiacus reevesi]